MKTAILAILWAALVFLLVNSNLQNPWLVVALATLTCSYVAFLYAARRFIGLLPAERRNIVYAVTVLFAVTDAWIVFLLFVKP